MSVYGLMSSPRHPFREREKDRMDRRVIRVEFPPAQAGIAAALRRAFERAPVDADECDRDFYALLTRLN